MRHLIASPRLVTLTGTAGVGKTRLALETGRALRSEYEKRVWLVELAALVDSRYVPSAVAAVIGLREQPGRGVVSDLLEVLRTLRCLLVLDNCEHLLSACAELVEAILAGCPGVRILSTSREPLRVNGETLWRVPQLSLPDAAAGGQSIQTLAAAESVRLFVERAQSVVPQFGLTTGNAAIVADVCLRLDGVPLAIELAAARTRVLGVRQLAQRLDDRLTLLSAGNRRSSPRQQTLRGAIDWSYELLSEGERLLFERLSVFAGGWTLEAAEAIGSPEPLTKAAVLDLLSALVEKSLAHADLQHDGTMRYRLLATLREYARERRAASSQSSDGSHRHAEYFVQLAEQAEPQLWGRTRPRGCSGSRTNSTIFVWHSGGQMRLTALRPCCGCVERYGGSGGSMATSVRVEHGARPRCDEKVQVRHSSVRKH